MNIVEIFGFQPQNSYRLPLFSMAVSAGRPVQVDDHIDKELDLNEFLVQHPAATYFVRVRGESMIDAGIHDGDILIVDSSLEATDGRVVVVTIDGEMTVKTLRLRDGQVTLEAQNKQYLPIKIEPFMEFHIAGVVTKVIHSL